MMKLNGLIENRCRLILLNALVVLVLLAGPVAATETVDIYQQDVPEMTTLECAKCHVQVFEALRDSGGLHKQQCRDCHAKFHSFTPGLSWAERVPTCSSCHEFPHGEAINICLDCHQNAHAPIQSMIAAEKLFDLCGLCHAEAQQQLAQVVSGHSQQSCIDCHSGPRHGQKPTCNSCHDQAHTEFIGNAGCVACHPPHAPSSVSYASDVPNSICGGCHAEQLQSLQTSEKQHQALACVNCHAEQHGNSRACQQCHADGPHNQVLLKNFASCSECHGDAHRLKL